VCPGPRNAGCHKLGQPRQQGSAIQRYCDANHGIIERIGREASAAEVRSGRKPWPRLIWGRRLLRKLPAALLSAVVEPSVAATPEHVAHILATQTGTCEAAHENDVITVLSPKSR